MHHLRRCSDLKSLLLASLLALSAAVACGDDAASSDDNSAANNSASNNSAANNGTPDPGLLLLGDCDPDDAATTCPGDAPCAATDVDALGVCPVLPTYYNTPGCGPTTHPDGVGQITPSCCTDAECAEAPGGRCVYTEQQTGCCGAQGATSCVYDACQSDAECPDATICLPAGTRGLAANACAPATCLQDADCADAPGGECRLLGRATFTALVCTYPDSPCRQDAECTSGPCGADWCAPVWSSTGQGWTLGDGVTCMEDDECLPRP
jgi:hypothetical protein